MSRRKISSELPNGGRRVAAKRERRRVREQSIQFSGSELQTHRPLGCTPCCLRSTLSLTILGVLICLNSQIISLCTFNRGAQSAAAWWTTVRATAEKNRQMIHRLLSWLPLSRPASGRYLHLIVLLTFKLIIAGPFVRNA